MSSCWSNTGHEAGKASATTAHTPNGFSPNVVNDQPTDIIRIDRMPPISLHFPLAGLAVLIGSIALIKGFDFLAAQSAQRLLETAGVRKRSR
jgi:hypothetical protein